MCENCKDEKDLINESEELQEPEYESYLEMNTDNLNEAELDYCAFQKGIDDYSYYSGAITALKTAGFNNAECLDLILNKETIDYNLKNQKIVCQNNIDVAKIQETVLQKQTI